MSLASKYSEGETRLICRFSPGVFQSRLFLQHRLCSNILFVQFHPQCSVVHENLWIHLTNVLTRTCLYLLEKKL